MRLNELCGIELRHFLEKMWETAPLLRLYFYNLKFIISFFENLLITTPNKMLLTENKHRKIQQLKYYSSEFIHPWNSSVSSMADGQIKNLFHIWNKSIVSKIKGEFVKWKSCPN